MPIEGLNHYNVDTSRPNETISFYCDVLGFVNRPNRRPDFGRPGAWLFVGDKALIHLNFVDDNRDGPTGALNHIAFSGIDYDSTRTSLDDHGVSYQAVESTERGFNQLFFKDPNNIRIEINFPT